MRTFIVFICCCGCLGSVPSFSRADNLDAMLITLITGRWAQDSTPYGIESYTADGGYQARLYRSKKQENQLAHLYGDWKIEKGILYNTLNKIEPSQLEIDKDHADKIVMINGSKMVLIDKQGATYTKVRLE